MKIQLTEDETSLTIKYEKDSEKSRAVPEHSQTAPHELEQRVEIIESSLASLEKDVHDNSFRSSQIDKALKPPSTGFSLKPGSETKKSTLTGSNYVLVNTTWVYIVVPLLIAIVVILGLILVLNLKAH